MSKLAPTQSTDAVEAFQIRLFWKEDKWVALVHSCTDNRDIQWIDPNLGAILTDVRKSIVKHDAELRLKAEPSPIIGLNGEPLPNGTNGTH